MKPSFTYLKDLLDWQYPEGIDNCFLFCEDGPLFFDRVPLQVLGAEESDGKGVV